MPSNSSGRSRPTPDSGPGQADTVPVQGERQQRTPRMPHEHDESADSQAGGEASAQRVGKTAHDDVASGQLDTDKGPVMDRTYDKVREGAQDPVKKFRP